MFSSISLNFFSIILYPPVDCKTEAALPSVRIIFPIPEHTSSMMKNKFIQCGLLGWCLEIFWTGLKSLRQRKMKLMGQSSIWMFPIYGMAFLFAPLSKLLRRRSAWFRGSVYMCLIFLMEYVSGTILKKRNCCPWDYSHAKLNIHGIIRLDYAPVWFLTGLLYERFLTRADRRKTL